MPSTRQPFSVACSQPKSVVIELAAEFFKTAFVNLAFVEPSDEVSDPIGCNVSRGLVLSTGDGGVACAIGEADELGVC